MILWDYEEFLYFWSVLIIIASHKHFQIQVSCTAGVEQTMDSWEGHVTGPATLSPNQWLMFKMWPALCVDLNTTSFSQVCSVFCIQGLFTQKVWQSVSEEAFLQTWGNYQKIVSEQGLKNIVKLDKPFLCFADWWIILIYMFDWLLQKYGQIITPK